MTAADTPRNGSPRVHPDLMPPAQRSAAKIQRDESGSSGRTLNSADPESSVTESRSFFDRFEAIIDWIKDFFVPPRWLVTAPPGWRELTDFALGSGAVDAPPLARAVRAIWLYGVVLPAVGKARVREWVLTRFWRAALFIGVTDLFIRTTPMGHWLAWLIRSWFHILAVVFLPA